LIVAQLWWVILSHPTKNRPMMRFFPRPLKSRSSISH
jgi:hypothetical protein